MPEVAVRKGNAFRTLGGDDRVRSTQSTPDIPCPWRKSAGGESHAGAERLNRCETETEEATLG